MYSFFNTKDVITYGEHIVAIWPQLKDNLDAQLTTVEMYYRNTNYYAPAAHFFVRLLQSLTVPKLLSDERYYANVKEVAMAHSSAMGMTSSINAGHLHSNVLYGKGSQEIVVVVQEDFDFASEIRDWQNMRAVTVVRHFRSDLLMAPLDGHTATLESGVPVIFVNIVKLAMQYRAFVFAEIRRERASVNQMYARATLQQFIYRYVFVNAVRSHYDLALLNRLIERLAGNYGAEVQRRLPFGMADYSQRIDYMLNKIIMGVQAKGKSIKEYLTYLPAVSQHSQREVVELPDIAPTRQVAWALNCAMEPFLRVYLLAGDGHGLRSNAALLTRLTRLQRSLNTNASYSQILPSTQYTQFKNTLNEFLGLAK